MAEQGLEAELIDIAHEAGVGVGTVYRCVGNRDEVIGTIVRDVIGQMATIFAEAEDKAEDDAEAGAGGVAGLLTLVTQLHEIVERYGWVHAVLIGGQLHEELRSEMRAIDPLRRFQRLYERAVARGDVRADVTPEAAAALVLGSLAPWSAHWLQVQGDSRAAAEAALSPFLTHPLPTDPTQPRQQAAQTPQEARS